MFSLIDIPVYVLVFPYYDVKLRNKQVGYYASKENLIGYLKRCTYLCTLKMSFVPDTLQLVYFL